MPGKGIAFSYGLQYNIPCIAICTCRPEEGAGFAPYGGKKDNNLTSLGEVRMGFDTPRQTEQER